MSDKRKHFYYSLDQVRKCGLIEPDRMAEIEREIESRIMPVFDGEGKELAMCKLANSPCGVRHLYHFHDHEKTPFEYMKKEIMRDVLTDEEIALISRHWSSAHNAKFETDHFEKAEKVTEWEGPVYFADTYYASLEDLLDEYCGGEEPEGYIWTCDVEPICTLDLGHILENACQDTPEDWDADELDGQKELEDAIQKFNELNASAHVAWSPNYQKALILKP